jgi:hypothetical protein
MPHYIRSCVPGGTFFFTVTLLERRRKLLTENIDTLRKVFREARRQVPKLCLGTPYITAKLSLTFIFVPNYNFGN